MRDDFIKVYKGIRNSVLNVKYWLTYLLRTRWLCAVPFRVIIIIITIITKGLNIIIIMIIFINCKWVDTRWQWSNYICADYEG
jgi:hypothetical protein